MIWLLLFLPLWAVLSFPLGMLIGRAIRRADCTQDAPRHLSEGGRVGGGINQPHGSAYK